MGDNAAIIIALATGFFGIVTTAFTVWGSIKKSDKDSIKYIADEREEENTALRNEVKQLLKMLSAARREIRRLDGDTGPFYPVSGK